jgi:hypothetical protein
VSATSSAQSHGGARRADGWPLLRSVSPDADARLDERTTAPLITARFEILNRQADCSHPRHLDRPPSPDGALAIAECRRTRNSRENDSHAQ